MRPKAGRTGAPEPKCLQGIQGQFDGTRKLDMADEGGSGPTRRTNEALGWAEQDPGHRADFPVKDANEIIVWKGFCRRKAPRAGEKKVRMT